jgi:hypothetical protein
MDSSRFVRMLRGRAAASKPHGGNPGRNASRLDRFHIKNR